MRHLKMVIICLSVLAVSACGGLSQTTSKQSQKQQIYGNLALYYLQQKQPQRAQEYITKAQQEGLQSIKIEHAKALLAAHAGRNDEAKIQFDKALQLSDNTASPMQALVSRDYAAFLCANNEAQEGLALLSSLNGPTNVHRKLVLGKCHVQAGQTRQGELHFRDVLKEGEYPSALFALADIAYQQNAYLSARGLLQRYFLKGAMSNNATKLAKAVERALQQDTQSESIYQQLVSVYPQVQWQDVLVQ